MKFSFTDEQVMLGDTSAGFLGTTAPLSRVRDIMVSASGFDAALWQQLCADMYWQAILVPEAQQGLGLGLVESVIVLEQMGMRLTPVPLGGVMAATLALRTCADMPRRQELLASIGAGRLVCLAHTAARPHWDEQGVEISATRTSDGWQLDGEARFVPAGHVADDLLVVARTGDGLALFHVRPDQAGVQRVKTPTLDQTRAMAGLSLDRVVVEPAACLAEPWSALASVLGFARIFSGAEQVGCAQASLDQSVAYTAERVQFGRTIASYQAIKHKAADMMLKAESARSLLYYAACVGDDWLAGRCDDDALEEAAAMLGSASGDAAFFCSGTGIQLHGGVGITEEYDIQLYFKRAQSLHAYLGRPDELRETLAAMLLDGEVTHAA